MPARLRLRFDGVLLHTLTAGRGEPLIPLHGHAETSRVWLALAWTVRH